MSELKTCPFCGCEPNGLKSHSPECFLVLWVEDSVSLNVPHELLAKAWNQRATPIPDTPEMVRALDDAYEAGRKSAERTCKVEWKHIGGDVAAGYCECGIELDRCHDYEPAHLPSFCPACGVKVVE